jgi:hypothetical protein
MTIRLARTGKYSIGLDLDAAGAAELARAFAAAARGEEGRCEAAVDGSLDARRDARPVRELRVVRSDDAAVSVAGGAATLAVDDDTIEHGLDLFRQCRERGEVFPAELAEVAFAGVRGGATIYCRCLARDEGPAAHDAAPPARPA